MDKVILITLFLALLAPLLIRIKLSYDKKLIKKIRGMAKKAGNNESLSGQVVLLLLHSHLMTVVLMALTIRYLIHLDMFSETVKIPLMIVTALLLAAIFIWRRQLAQRVLASFGDRPQIWYQLHYSAYIVNGCALYLVGLFILTGIPLY